MGKTGKVEESTFQTSIGPAEENMKEKIEKDRLAAGIKTMKFRKSPFGKFAEAVQPIFQKFQKKP